MEYFVFKLNLEPNILRIYNYESNRAQVVSEVVPNALKKIFADFESIYSNKIKFVDHIDIEEAKTSLYFQNLIELNEVMIEMYEGVVEEFTKGKGITYSPDYLEQRNKLKKSIIDIISKYPFLRGAFDLSDDVFPVKSFFKVKMAVAYMKRAKKIESYINNFPSSDSKSEFIYDMEYEYIYISKKNKTSEKAIDFIELLEEKINSFSSTTNIGRVSINPIYTDIFFEGLHSEVTVEIVYPNGDPARDRSKAIEQVNAASEERQFNAPKSEKIDSSKLSEHFEEYGKKGYLRRVTSQGKSIIKSLIKTVNF